MNTITLVYLADCDIPYGTSLTARDITTRISDAAEKVGKVELVFVGLPQPNGSEGWVAVQSIRAIVPVGPAQATESTA